jgi:hypothetical protein
MRHNVTKELFAYWDSLKGARAAPDRSEIDPAAIRHLLADSFIVEIDAGVYEFPLRVCGARLNSLWLCEQKGRSFLDLWRDHDRTNAAAALMTVSEVSSPIVGSVRGDGTEFEILLLPLLYFGKSRLRVMGSLSTNERPVWFGSRPMGPLTLKSLRVMDEARPQPFFVAPKIRPPSAAESRPPRLVVYQGGKSRYR